MWLFVVFEAYITVRLNNSAITSTNPYAKKITGVEYPAHCLAKGPIETVGFERESRTLSGFYLDYALACACDYSAISLRFLPGLAPHLVKVGENFNELETWSPTQNKDLAQNLVKRFLNRVEEGTTSNLVEIVIQQVGEKITLLRPAYEFS